MPDLDHLIAFAKFTHLLHKVERVARIAGEERYANTVEHSYQLALVAWYVITTHKLDMRLEKVLCYALAHDCVEAYAGDTYAYDVVSQADKILREQQALEKIATDFSEFEELANAIRAYDKREDIESRFVYALDKLIDPINIYLENGKLWKENGVTLAMHEAYKSPKIAYDPTVQKLHEELLQRLRAHESDFFALKK
ncbi:MAG: HD domain-containing protein [Minisyncoccia bacterium]